MPLFMIYHLLSHSVFIQVYLVYLFFTQNHVKDETIVAKFYGCAVMLIRERMNAMTLSWFAAFFHFSLSFYSINKKCFYFRNMTCRLRNMLPFNTIFLLVWYSDISFYMRMTQSSIFWEQLKEKINATYHFYL